MQEVNFKNLDIFKDRKLEFIGFVFRNFTFFFVGIGIQELRIIMSHPEIYLKVFVRVRYLDEQSKGLAS